MIIASLTLGGCLRSVGDIPAVGEGVFVSGTVVQRDRLSTELAPVPGVVVRVMGSTPRALTNEDGRFDLERLPVGRIRLGLELRASDGTVLAARLLEPFNGVVQGQRIDLGALELSGTGAVVGVALRDRPGAPREPAAGALVVAAETGFKAVVGESGEYVLAGLPEGTVDVVAFQSGYLPARAQNLRVSPSAQLTADELVLVKSAEVPRRDVTGTATLLGAPGASSGIRVVFTDSTTTTPPSFEGTTDAAGDYTVAGVPAGVYRATFSKDGYQSAALDGVAVLPEAVLGLSAVTLRPSIAGDLDGDGLPDATDPDRDNDGCANEADQFPDDPGACRDADGDGVPDELDPDADGDGLSNAEEVTPGLDGWVTSALDPDGDGDGVRDDQDDCPTIADPAQTDTDEDGEGDACDRSNGGGSVTPPPRTPAPRVFGFDPLTGPQGTLITIHGEDFDVTTPLFNAVRFGATGPIVSPVATATDTLVVEVPEDAVTGALRVFTHGRLLTTTSTFTFLPRPVVTSFAPRAVRRGATISVLGQHFGAAPSVLVGGAPGLDVVVTPGSGAQPDQLYVRVPPQALTGKISVTNDGAGQSATDLVVLDGPRVLQLAPSVGQVGATVVVIGTGFGTTDTGGAPALDFTGATQPWVAAAAPTTWSDGSFEVVVPAGAANGPVRLRHPAGDSVTTFSFILDVNAPYITSLQPPLAKVGETVVIAGANLATATAVAFNGVPATFSLSGATLVATVPTAASARDLAGPVTVTLPGGATVTSPRRMAILERTNSPVTDRMLGMGFSGDGQHVYALDLFNQAGLILDAHTLAEVPAGRVALPFLSAGSQLNGFHVAPSGDVAVLFDIASSGTYGTWVLSLPTFTPIGVRCLDQPYQQAVKQLRFDAQSTFAYAKRPTALGSVLRDGVFRVDLRTGACDTLDLGPVAGVNDYVTAVLPGASAAELYLGRGSTSGGLGVLDVQPGSPQLGTLTTPFQGVFLPYARLVWAPGLGSLWGVSGASVNHYSSLFTADPPFTLTTAVGGEAVQTESLRWVFIEGAIFDLTTSERVRTSEPDVAIYLGGAGARGDSVVVARGGANGLARLDLYP